MALNVLLVDDEYLVLKGLEIILSEQTETSVKIVTAMDVEDALNKLTSFRPDVIITDINMPESNGFELIKQAQQNFPHCRFIICSGYDEQSYLKQALHLHVDDYLLKPIDKSLLIHRLKELEVEKERNISHVLMRIQLLLLNGNSYSDDLQISSNGFFLILQDRQSWWTVTEKLYKLLKAEASIFACRTDSLIIPSVRVLPPA